MADLSSLMPSAGAALLVGAMQAVTLVVVGLHLDLAALRRVLTSGRPLLLGFAAQWLLPPLLTLALLALARPAAGTALGLMLVAATPGGGAAVYFSLIGRGDAVLATALTTASTLAAALLTPAVFAALAWLQGAGGAAAPMQLDFLALACSAVLLMVLPLLLGLGFRHRFPQPAARLRGPLKLVLGLLLAATMAVTLRRNAESLAAALPLLAPLVAAHNAVALFAGYLAARWAGLPPPQRRTVSLGAGINNSGIALAVALNLFSGNAEALAVVLWWSGWRLASAGILALLWTRRGHRDAPAATLPLPP